jgi:peptidoglycan lytic transglycosylase G
MAEHDPYVRYQPRPRRGGHGLAAIGGVLLAAAILAGIGWGVTRALDGDDPPPPPTEATDTAPALPVLKIVFPEGFTRADMAKRIGEVNKIAERKRNITPKLSPAAYLKATKSGPIPADFKGEDIPNLEGFLFPATYEFTEETTSKELSRKQLEAFDRAWSEVNLDFAKEKNLTAYDVLIIASMVEKEVQVPKERALVAGVIYNRLKAGMPLGIDATIRYGFNIPPTQAILQSQLDSDNPYNSRKVPGLPPTPISNPGLAAIQAAAHPAETDYLFFVRKADCKSHFFTASQAEFDAYPRAGLQC